MGRCVCFEHDYRKDGAADHASDVTDGALVRVHVCFDADGYTLDATTVDVHQP